MKHSFRFVVPIVLLFCTFAFSQQTPFRGSPFKLPGLIEAEEYDRGGEGFAYHDTEPDNLGGAFRPREGVDLESSTENGYNIGWIQPDEWVEYTVDVQTAGVYKVEVRTAAANEAGYFHLELDRVNITGRQMAPVTGGWQTWTTVVIPQVYLRAGQGVLRLYMESANFNVNSMRFTLVKATQPPNVAITSPANNSVHPVAEPLTITASASDPDGTVSRVEFFADGTTLGQDFSSPYSVVWTPSRTGEYQLTARAVDNDGGAAVSAPVTVKIKAPDYLPGPIFSAPHGFYDKAFDLYISSDITGGEIRWSLDGSNPVTSPTAKKSFSPAKVRIDPVSRDGRGDTPAVVVRAVVVKDGKQMTAVLTNTYVFVNRVRWQKRPTNWPESGINGQYIRFDVSREVVLNDRYKDWVEKALLDIPTMSLVTDMENLFDPKTGIYVNAVERGIEWERPASLELILPDGSEGFQINMGVRIRGGYSRHPAYPKHAFRVFFRDDYGAAKLKYPLFGDEGVDEFDKIDLRCSQNYSWANGDVLDTGTRDVFSRDLQREMGQPYTRSRPYHLYLNGMYWGLYETQERSEASYAASYFGGSKEDYDVVKVDAGWMRSYQIEATDGNLDAWKRVWDACVKGFKANADYFALEGRKADGTPDPNADVLVDIDNLIDYMLVIFHTGNYDSPVSKFGNNQMPNNFYAIYNRVRRDGFKFFAHDNEHTLLIDPVNVGDGIDENRVNIGRITGPRKMNVGSFSGFHPQWLHFKLSENPEYRMRFADHVYRHYFNNGIFLPERARELFLSRTRMLDLAIIAESARWGDLTRSKYGSWQRVVQDIAEVYFDQRYDIVLGQYIDEGLYPPIDPPLIYVGGAELKEERSRLTSNEKVELRNPNSGGSIYYTLDGSDPRAIGGAVASTAVDAGKQKTITLTASTVLKARVKSGSTWSALHAVTFVLPASLKALKITEIHYKPLPNGDVSGSEYEFLEFKNCSGQTLDLSLASLVKGVQYSFPVGSMLQAGKHLVIASNAAEFKNRYGWAPFGQYEGQLDNKGERIVLVSAAGDTVIDVRYSNKALWPEEAADTGRSLAACEVDPSGNPNDPAYWRASYKVGGSPGRDDNIAAEIDGGEVPQAYELMQNYPNPFNASTRIDFTLPEESRVRLQVYDLLGRLVDEPTNELYAAGRHSINWDASDHPPGVYFLRAEWKGGSRAIKMLLVK